MTKAFHSAIHLLSRREHGAKELQQKLGRKGYNQAEAQEALDKCQELGLQSDAKFIEHFIRARIQQGYGPLKIAYELKNKGLAEEKIQQGLQEEQDNWVAYAMAVWQKKSKGQVAASFDELQKYQRFLLYRGFDRAVIAELMREMGNI